MGENYVFSIAWPGMIGMLRGVTRGNCGDFGDKS
jgi:hypothetical protein